MNTVKDLKEANGKGLIHTFAKGLQLPTTKGDEVYSLQVIDDEKCLNISEPFTKLKSDHMMYGKCIVSILGVVTTPDGKKKDFSKLRPTSIGQMGGIGCTNSDILDNIQQGQVLTFKVIENKGSHYANFVVEDSSDDSSEISEASIMSMKKKELVKFADEQEIDISAAKSPKEMRTILLDELTANV